MGESKFSDFFQKFLKCSEIPARRTTRMHRNEGPQPLEDEDGSHSSDSSRNSVSQQSQQSAETDETPFELSETSPDVFEEGADSKSKTSFATTECGVLSRKKHPQTSCLRGDKNAETESKSVTLARPLTDLSDDEGNHQRNPLTHKRFRVMMMGQSGVGKSYLSQMLLGRNYSAETSGFEIASATDKESCTKTYTVQVAEPIWDQAEVETPFTFELMDVPGLADTHGETIKFIDEMRDTVAQFKPHVLLVIADASESKFNDLMRRSLKCMKLCAIV